MFGTNPILNYEESDGSKLRVVNGKPWITIQGEGPYIGHPATFIRLHGCNLACTFCDTEFSNPVDPLIGIEQLVAQCLEGPNLVVITGGEPLRQNIVPLCKELVTRNKHVQIETAGTLWINGLQLWADIICSPKTPKIHPQIFEFAKAFKYVISHKNLHDTFIPITATQEGARISRLALPRPGAPVYLSPMDEADVAANAANRMLVGRMAIEYRCIAGIQLHKILGQD